MNLKKLFLFFIIFTGVSYYYFHHVVVQDEQVKQSEFDAMRIVKIAENTDVTYLSIEYADNEFVMERTAQKQWMLMKPVSDCGDDVIIDGIISTLRMSKKERVLESVDFDAAVIGLYPPRIRVGIGIGDKKRYLLLGEKTHVGGLYYARWEDDEQVFLVSQLFYNVFQKSLFTLRSKYVFDIDFKALSRINIRFGDDSCTLEYLTENNCSRWWITHPIENFALETKVNQYVLTLRRLLASGFYDDAVFEDPTYGFSIDRNYISLTCGQTKTVLFVGNKTSDKNKYFAIVENQQRVIELAADMVEELKLRYADFIDMRIAPFSVEVIDEIVYSRPSRRVVYNKNENEWVQIEPIPLRVNQDLTFTIEQLMFACSTLAYQSIIEPKHLETLALTDDDMVFSIAFTTTGSGQSTTIIFSSRNSTIYAQVKGDVTCYEIPVESYDQINAFLKSIL